MKYTIIERIAPKFMSLDEVKNFLRVPHNNDDANIQNMINASIVYAEEYMHRSLYSYNIALECTITKSMLSSGVVFEDPLFKTSTFKIDVVPPYNQFRSSIADAVSCINTITAFKYKKYDQNGRFSGWGEYDTSKNIKVDKNCIYIYKNKIKIGSAISIGYNTIGVDLNPMIAQGMMMHVVMLYDGDFGMLDTVHKMYRPHKKIRIY